MENSIIRYLFETKAIQVCSEDKPFWYASGTLGPYYINTHYLYGSKEEAEDLLSFIEECCLNKEECPGKLFSVMMEQYNKNSIYKSVIDLVVSESNKLSYDFVSGGERRDFFFSILTAYFTKKPHLSIFKDGTTILSDYEFKKSAIAGKDSLKGKESLHVVDLVTEASSYVRAWIPAVESVGAKISHTIAIVDRNQGGREILEEKGITFKAFALIKQDLFNKARLEKYISNNQYEMIHQFILNPGKFMSMFIVNHPHFLEDQINLGGKAKERALLYMERSLDQND
ncbi:MAG: orotate phosphoribosyltransferase [Saccharofermentanales bacterium]